MKLLLMLYVVQNFWGVSVLSHCNGLNFLHDSSISATAYICDQNNTDNTLMSWVLISSVCTAPRPPLLLTLLQVWLVWRCKIVREGKGRQPKLTKAMPYSIMVCQKIGKRGIGWTLVYLREVVSDCLYITCFVLFVSSSIYPSFITF